MDRVWELVESCTIDNCTVQSDLACPMLYVSLSHCDVIQLLLEQGNLASTNALLRPLFETTIRSIWLCRCASEDQVTRCIETDDWKSPWVLSLEIESSTDRAPVLSWLWSGLRSNMHRYTHGGIQNAVRHIGVDEVITPNISEDDILTLMKIVGFLSLMILCE